MNNKYNFLLTKVIRRSVLAFLIGVIAGPQTAVLFFATIFIIDALCGGIWKMCLLLLKKQALEYGVSLPIMDSERTYAEWKVVFDTKIKMSEFNKDIPIDLDHVIIFTSGFMDPVCICFNVKEGNLHLGNMSEALKAYGKMIDP